MNDIPGVTAAQPWSLFTGQFGRGCIYSACGVFLLSAVLWVLQTRYPQVEKAAKWLFGIGCVSLLAAFGALTLLFVKDQFQYSYVFDHGDSTTDLKYKIAGVWTSQEGSFLLWACTSAIFGLLTVAGTGIYRRWFSVVYAGFLACLSAILAYETPFGILPQAVAHGQTFVLPRGAGMTPSLQNYWVVIHPPTIFTGFGSLTVFFAYAAAAMIQGNAKEWVSQVRPWVLLSTAILGVGIVMGGLWAYDTQGWGGFWAWDPVECASFVPWLFTVVLAHGILVQVSRGKWAFTNLLLGGLPFLSFVYGTFLTRSGLLDKVSLHSFAEMNQSALVILRWFMIAVTAAFVAGFAFFGKRAAAAVARPAEPEGAIEREGAYRYGMMLLSMIAVVITLGMSWPVIVALRGGEGKSVEEWLYHQVSVWFFIPIMLLMAAAPFISWRGMSWRELWNRLFTTVCVAVGLTGFAQMGLMAPKIGVHPAAGETVAG
ncbi:MAG TPA: cytochrome c biogenesis protein CcsA, partial [Verrucomicrobiae bacterium]|nr:cytochrome c biogenesis protein CcsA [Verrucomicrobiae bacterium]